MQSRTPIFLVGLSLAALIVVICGSLAVMADDPPQKAKQPAGGKPKENSAAWLSLDLRPALSTSLLSEHIRDEGATVRASPGRIFVTLPFRYNPNAGPATVSRSTIRGVEGKWFYGLRLLPVSKGRPRLELDRGEPVYERVSLQPRETGRLLLSARNNMGPRRQDKDKSRQEPLKGASVAAAGSGWLAMVIETPAQTSTLKLEFAGGGELEVDLDLVRLVRDEHPSTVLGNPASPPVSVVLRKVESPSSATACLAIGWLAATRHKLGRETPPAWVEQVDGAVIAAGGREQVDVRGAAWEYISSCGRLPERTLRHITSLKPEARRRWCWLVEDHLAVAVKPRGSIATQVLSAVLAGEDEASCEAALDVALAHPDVIRCELMGGLSAKAQSLILARLDQGVDQLQAARWVDLLLKDGKPSLAGEIAARAKKFGVRIGRPDHPMLLQWRGANNEARKQAIVTALAAADMGDVVYSPVFADLIEEATASKADGSLRRAGFELLIRQARRRYGAGSTVGGAKVRAGADGQQMTRLRGCFPVRLGKKARDPLLEGLTKAAREGDEPTRCDATALLLAGGFADKAEAVVRGVKTGEGRDTFIKAIMEHEEAADTYGLMAMLGGLLDEENASSSGLILRYLDQAAQKLDKSERWQLAAALKAGVRFDRLHELSLGLGPTASPLAARWLVELGHMSPQDQQRLGAPGGSDERMARLKRIDGRRASLVDGTYGVIALLEILISEEQQRSIEKKAAGGEAVDADDEAEEVESPAASPKYRWRAPRLVTVTLPPLRIVSSDADASYGVLWGERKIGEGRTRRGNKPIRGPEEYCDLLVQAKDTRLGPDGWGWRIEETAVQEESLKKRLQSAFGPALLPSGKPQAEPGEDTMLLEVGEYLQAGFREALASRKDDGDAGGFIPKKVPLSLGYGSFGSFHGVGARAYLSPAVSADKWVLQNVALILEKID